METDIAILEQKPALVEGQSSHRLHALIAKRVSNLQENGNPEQKVDLKDYEFSIYPVVFKSSSS